MIGAGIGGAAGAMSADEGNRVSGAIHGALRGGAIGGLGAGVGRAYRDTRLLAASKNQPLSAMGAVVPTAQRLGRQAMNFGKRQWYGATGMGNPDDIRMAGNATSARKARLLDLRAADEMAHAPSLEAKEKLRQNAQSAVKSELESGQRSQALQDAGVTNVPGMAKALWDPQKRRMALRAMGRTMADGPGGIGLSVGLPVAFSAPELLRGDESAQGGKSMTQKVVGLGANLATGAAFGGMPIVPQLALGTAADMGVQRAFRPRNSPQQAYTAQYAPGSVYQAPNFQVQR